MLLFADFQNLRHPVAEGHLDPAGQRFSTQAFEADQLDPFLGQGETYAAADGIETHGQTG